MSAADGNGVGYLIFDIESVADPALVSLVRTHGEQDPEAALQEYRDELMAEKGSDFIPYTFQVPVSLALAKVGFDFSLQDLIVLKVENGGPGAICENFWKGWKLYDHPQLVTFNGRKFDVPLLEHTAFRYGISIPDWYMGYGGLNKQPRNRYGSNHLDLFDALTNYGSSNFVAGLNLAAKLLHKPGKMDVKGDMVQDMFKERRLDEIHRYCRCDVLDTYFVFLRYQRITGRLDAPHEQELIEKARDFLIERKDSEPVYGEYLDAWDKTSAFLERNDFFAEYEKK